MHAPGGFRLLILLFPKDLLPTIDGNPQTYVKYGKWFYPADLPLEAVRQLADGGPVTKELVVALNPKRNEWEEIKAGLDKIGSVSYTHLPCERVGGEAFAHRDTLFHHRQ